VIRKCIAAMSALLLSSSVAAQQLTTPEPGSNLTIYLLTMGPGDQVWEKFGHNAIWIHDDLNRTDIAYHWGLFDFADKNFVPNFARGRMRYSMGAFDMEETVDQYRRTNRTVWAQRLNLQSAQKQRLAEFVAWNIRPENRFYHYDYFRDNCSTRVRDALDLALGGAIKSATGATRSGTSYRFHTARLTQDDWPVFTGTMLGLGEPVDREITVWEEMFLPVRMMDQLVRIRVNGARGLEPLVQDARVIVQATREPEESGVHRGILGYLLISAIGLLIGYGLWILGGRGARKGPILTLAIVWSMAAGLAGTVLAGLWVFTDHLYSYRNENLFQLNPLSLVLAVALAGSMWRRRSGGSALSRFAVTTARIVAGLSLLGFVLQLLPALDQVNGSAIALSLPLHIGVLALLTAIESPASPSEPEAV
jgi:uncharacterized protein DUF4105